MVSIAMGAIVVGASFAAAWRVTGLVIRRPSRQLERLRDALTEIRDEQGRVCSQSDTCTHASCRSSYASWAIAHRALRRR